MLLKLPTFGLVTSKEKKANQTRTKRKLKGVSGG